MRGSALLWLPCFAAALAGPQEEPFPRPLSLEEAIASALERNLDLQVARAEPRIAGQDLARARGAFDPTLSLSYKDRDQRQETTSALSGAGLLATRDTTYAAALKEKLPTGTTLDLTLSYLRSGTNSLFSTLNPTHTTTGTLTVTQPILQGSGLDANLADARKATQARAAARHDLEAKVTQTVASVEEAYWVLVGAREDVSVRRSALEAARSLETANRAKEEAGAIPKTDALEAAAGAASREADLIDAERKAQDAQDRLCARMGLPQPWDPGFLPSDRPALPEVSPDPEASVSTALARRPELARARAEAERTRIGEGAAANTILPDLSVSGSWGHASVDADREASLQGLDRDQARTWEVGISLEIPLGNRAARSDHLKARLQRDQAEMRRRALEQDVVAEVRAAVRAATQGRIRLEAQERAVILASEKLRAETLRHEQGLSTTHAVLEALQADTAERGRRLSAQLDFLKAVRDWHKSQATLLETRGITLEYP